MYRCSLLAVAAVGLLAQACADTATGPRLAIDVAPLNLAGVTGVTWRLTVVNSDDEPVLRRTLASDDYGDGGGAITFVGPCDASKSPNEVQLELISLSVAAGPLTAGVDFMNPAPEGSPIVRSAPCVANRDTRVTFDVTIARAARQGFFDIAVELGDVFCSAKLDCERAPDSPLLLLHDADGVRAPTAVLALACAAGDAADVWLYLNAIALDCDGTSFTVDPSLGPGRLSAIAGSGLPNAHFFDALVTTGDAGPVRYWNVALGLDDVDGCSLSARATASDAALAGLATPADSVWPVLVWSLEDFAACGQHGLGDPDGVVTVAYTVSEGEAFDHERGPDGASAPPDPTPPGEAPEAAGVDCDAIYQADSTATSDFYYIDPDGEGGLPPFEVYCEMVAGDGGWTLFAHHRDGHTTNVVDVVSPAAGAWGVLGDARWLALRDGMVVGMRFIDELGRDSRISAAKLRTGRCSTVDDVDSLVPGNRTRLWYDEIDCNGVGQDYSQIYLAVNGTWGASLYNMSAVKFDVWPYPVTTHSYGNQDELLYYIR